MAKNYGQVGKSAADVKQTKRVGKSEFAGDDDQPDADHPGTRRTPHGRITEVLPQMVSEAESVLKQADGDWFAKQEEMRRLQAEKQASEKAAQEALGLHASMNQQKALLNAEREWDYYCCIVFQSSVQRRAFLEAIKWNWEERGGLYIDGQELARQLSIPLPPGPKWKSGEPRDIWEELAFNPEFFDC